MLSKQLINAAAGNAGGDVLGVEDVFSTWLYTGNGSTQTITNGIDLAGEGGMVWLKKRSATGNNVVHDTVRGFSKRLNTDTTGAESTLSAGLGVTGFNSDGFSLGTGSVYNDSGSTYASWTFRKAAKFFDVVTFTATSVSNRRISHNLGSEPGMIIIKSTSTSGAWAVYHRSEGRSKVGFFDTSAFLSNANVWGASDPTTTDFGINETVLTAVGETYVAYLFAHDAGGFGDDGTESVIKCGSYAGTGAAGNFINLGWEPQWVLVKKSSGPTDTGWQLLDNMRGITDNPTSGTGVLFPNLSSAENDVSTRIKLLATGFEITATTNVAFNDASSTYIYIAIRRGPMKTPTDATKVFNVQINSGNGVAKTQTVGFAPDLAITSRRSANDGWVSDRLRAFSNSANRYLVASSTSTETALAGVNFGALLDGNVTGQVQYANGSANHNQSGISYANWFFRRAPGYFDVVAYTGTGSATTVSHNLGVVPELMIVKRRNLAESWAVYSSSLPASDRLRLNFDGGAAAISTYWNSTAPTSSVFTVGSDNATNASGSTYIAYLFASCPGVSKVGSYTGTGTTLDIDCGFTSGARFVLIKRTDSTGDWYVWDTARGIVSGNDPYLLLNSPATAENPSTDYIDPLSSGFQISSTAPAAINANGGSYIFLAIA